jgi:rifampicin phosphotransferase
MSEPWILWSGEPAERRAVGGKAAALGALSGTGMAVPPWFAVTVAAFEASVEPGARGAIAEGDAEAIAALRAAEPVSEAVAEAVARLGVTGPFAVRSSAVDEDGSAHSFAGQLESFLNVAAADVPAKVADVWRSGFSERVGAYRELAGAARSSPPAVLVQAMIDAVAAGVAFGADPLGGARDIAVVTAVPGCGSALVSGDADADTWSVDARGTIVSRAIASKRTKHVADASEASGVRLVAISGPDVDAPALDDEQVRGAAELARACGRHFGVPQDTEWAVDRSGVLWLLQSRPITNLPPDVGSELNIWDNSNIAESYAGVTTPLTFSFARGAYEEVYRQLCRILGVPEPTIARMGPVYARMLGLIDGRVYYNLLSWYLVLATLPGFRFNRRFMEQMMGVSEGVPDEVLAGLEASGRGARLRDAAALARTLAGLVAAQATLERRIERFYARLHAALVDRDVAAMRADQLASHYHDLESRLLTTWDAPLVNDLFAMVFHGLLRSLCEKWCADEGGMLANGLLSGEGGLVSAEPARRVRRLAELAADDAGLLDVLETGDAERALREMESRPAFLAEYDEYLRMFGDRCLEELKLESATVVDDPLPLLRSVAGLALRIRAGDAPQDRGQGGIRAAAQVEVSRRLGARIDRKAVFAWVLKGARARVRDRENLRFERTRLFGRVRRIFVALGERLVEAGVLQDSRDVFYLQVDEALGFADGTGASADLAHLAAVRRAEFERYRSLPAPPERFETRGALGIARRSSTLAPVEAVEGETLTGLGCCPGVVIGRVRVVVDPRGATIRANEVLVAERTDPGWVMLFPAASGVLVERGSLLSHSAIVTRELGIPSVVSLRGLTSWLHTGDLVEFDGSTGVVRRLERVDGDPHGE